MTVRALFLVLIALVLAQSTPAFASDDALDGEAPALSEAREQFRRASEAAQAGRWLEALELYRASAEHHRHATTLSNIGYCHERLGDYAAALRETLAALELGSERPERALRADQRAQAEAAVAQLKSRVGRIRFTLAGKNVSVRVDGLGLRTVTHGGETLAFADDTHAQTSTPVGEGTVLVVNPGSRRVEWRSGDAGHAHTLVVEDGTEVELELEPTPPRSASLAAPVTTSVSPATEVFPLAPSPHESAGEPGVSTWVVASFAASGVALVTGASAGAVAWSTKRKLDSRCSEDGSCPGSQRARIERFQTSAALTNAALAVASVTLATGIVLVILDADSEPSPLRLRLSTRLELEGAF